MCRHTWITVGYDDSTYERIEACARCGQKRKAEAYAGPRPEPKKQRVQHFNEVAISPLEDFANPWGKRNCVECGGEHLAKLADETPRCFDCSKAHNPYHLKGIRMSIDSTGEDSSDPGRVKEGTHIYNMGLPPVTTVLPQKDAYGQHKVESRPVANNEVASSRRLREMAKRGGLTIMDKQKRAIGGK